MEFRFFALLIFLSGSVFSQSPRVPSKMQFADIKLRIMDDARKEIQEDVDALTRSPRYFEIKAEKARSYFPIIERVFREENLPDDFKYLVLQESALIADAVSSSNAVGFWQFKDFTALEMGLRVDKQVDERMNIVSASRGASRYLKRNNNRYFDNWLITLMAYQMGEGAAIKAGGEKYRGAKSMVVNKKTYWYIKKYLAHRIAFQNVGNKPTQIPLAVYENGANKTFKQISEELGVDEEVLKEYNKWLRKGKIPADRKYTIVMPGEGQTLMTSTKKEDKKPNNSQVITSSTKKYGIADSKTFPKIDDALEARAGEIVKINGLPGIIAGSNDRISALASKGSLDLGKFLKYNDLSIDDKLKSGEVYYLKKKRTKAQAHYHVLLEGETLWSVSQKYAIRLAKLKAKNRIKGGESIKTGRVLWLRFIRPANVEVEYKSIEKELKKEPEMVTKEADTLIAKNDRTTLEPDEVVKPTEIVKDEKRPLTFLEKLDSLERLESKKVIEDPVVPLTVNGSTKKVEKIPPVNDVDVQVSSNELLNQQEDDINTQGPDSVMRMHSVKAGETYYAISKIYDVDLLDILEWNNLKISDKLSIDQKLKIFQTPKITKSDVAIPQHITHTVRAGDTLTQIARTYNVTIQDLMNWNDMSEDQIKLGEVLQIKKSDR